MVEIIANSTHSEQRTRDFFKFHLLKVNPMRYVYFSISIIFLIISVVFFLLMKYENSLFFLFVSLIVLVIRVASVGMLVNRIMSKIVLPSKNYKLIFNESEVIYSVNESNKNFKWSDLVYIYEVKNYIFFYIDKNSALILTKYSLSVDEVVALKAMIIKSNVKYKNKKFK